MKVGSALRKDADSGDCWKGFRPGDLCMRQVTKFAKKLRSIGIELFEHI